MRNKRISPTIDRNGLSQLCGANALAKVIRIEIVINATMN